MTTAKGKLAKRSPEGSSNPLKLASKVADRAKIANVFLTESTIVNKLSDKKLPGNLSFRVSTKTQVKKADTGDETGVTLLVSVRFELVGTYPEASPEKERLRIDASFQLVYTVDPSEGLDNDSFQAFGELNGMYNCYPYWREYLHTTTARMGLPPLVAPLFKPGRTQASKKPRDTSC